MNFNTSVVKRTTWVISSTIVNSNTVYLFEAFSLNADCKSTKIYISTKSENSNSELAYCDKKKIEYLLPGLRQLWVTLDVKEKPDTLQTISFTYQVEELGKAHIS